MVQGNEMREMTKDINVDKARARQPDSVPLSPVRGPQPASFSKVGAEAGALADVLGSASGMLESYARKRQDEDRVRGSIARSQGQTLEEAKKLGRDVGSGWQIADLKIRGDELLMTEEENIKRGGYATDPQAYGERLSNMFVQATNSLPDDPLINKYVADVGEKVMGRLAGIQLAAHQDYNYEQTRVKVGEMLNSTLDTATPDSITDALEFMKPGAFGLKPEDHENLLVNVAKHRLESKDDPSLYRLLAVGMTDDPAAKQFIEQATSATPAGLADVIAFRESSGKNVQDDGSLTLGPEVINSDGTVRQYNGKPDRARGKYQVMESTFHDTGLRKALGLSEKGDYTKPEEVEDFGRKLIDFNSAKQNGIPELIALSHIGGQNFVDNWSSKLGLDPRKGDVDPLTFVRMAGDGGEKHMERLAYVNSIMEKYNPADAIINIPGTIKASPEGLLALQSSYSAYLKRNADNLRVESAVNNNTVNMLPSAKEKKAALNMLREQARSKVQQDNPMQPGENEMDYADRTAKQALTEYIRSAASTTVVDEEFKGYYNRVLDPANAIVNGAVSKEAVSALESLATIEMNTPTGYFSKYIPQEGNDFVLRALSYVANGGDPTEALQKSHRIQTQIDKGEMKIPKMEAKDFSEAYEKITEEQTVSLWERFAPDVLQNRPHLDAWTGFATNKDDMRAGMKSELGEQYKRQVQSLAEMYYPDMLDARAATVKALADVQPRTMYMFGKPILLPRGETPESIMGLPPGTLGKYQGALNVALGEYIRSAAEYGALEGLAADVRYSWANFSDTAAKFLTRTIGGTYEAEVAERRKQSAKIAMDSLGVFGRKYNTFTGDNNGVLSWYRSVPDYKDIAIKPDLSSGRIAINIKDKDTGNASPFDLKINMRLLGKMIEQKIKEE